MKINVGFCLFIRVFKLDWIYCKMLGIRCLNVIYLWWKLIENNKNMMKKVMELWKKWFGERDASVVENVAKEVSVKTEKNPRKSSLLEDLETYLFAMYDFRFNVLTEQTEYRKKCEGVFHMVDQRVLNTLCMKARNQGINCWDKDVSRLLLSEQIPDFHPFTGYADSLPEWDGIDRVSELARRGPMRLCG